VGHKSRTAKRINREGSETGTGRSISFISFSLKDARDEETEEAEPKFRRTGTSGCCGRGCNGCLMFWHDPAYAKGRELMKQKKLGEKLERKVRE
jgi:putative protease